MVQSLQNDADICCILVQHKCWLHCILVGITYGMGWEHVLEEYTLTMILPALTCWKYLESKMWPHTHHKCFFFFYYHLKINDIHAMLDALLAWSINGPWSMLVVLFLDVDDLYNFSIDHLSPSWNLNVINMCYFLSTMPCFRKW